MALPHSVAEHRQAAAKRNDRTTGRRPQRFSGREGWQMRSNGYVTIITGASLMILMLFIPFSP
jgi:hypothetical protein